MPLVQRDAILADATASVALSVLAADADTWVAAYLAALEEAGPLGDIFNRCIYDYGPFFAIQSEESIRNLHIAGHYDADHGVRIDGGHITLPEGPGLGITPDEGVFGEPVLSLG